MKSDDVNRTIEEMTTNRSRLRVRQLAEQAGFVMWSDCDWKPEGEVIDWASNYDDELEKFAELVRADEREACAKVCESMGIAIRARGDVHASDISQEPVDKTAKREREWVGLTEEEREQVRSSAGYNQFMSAGEYAEAVQWATEAKLKEKNNG